MSATKKGFSCLEFQCQLGLSRYETAFKLVYKIRADMGRRDGLYQLKDMVEYDEGYVEVATKKQGKKQLKRGKGSQRQAKVAVAAESIPIEDSESGQQKRVCGYFKMEVLDKVDSENVNKFIKRNTVYINLEVVPNTHYIAVSSK